MDNDSVTIAYTRVPPGHFEGGHSRLLSFEYEIAWTSQFDSVGKLQMLSLTSRHFLQRLVLHDVTKFVHHVVKVFASVTILEVTHSASTSAFVMYPQSDSNRHAQRAEGLSLLDIPFSYAGGVAQLGVEPRRLAAQLFESCVSTYSTIGP